MKATEAKIATIALLAILIPTLGYVAFQYIQFHSGRDCVTVVGFDTGPIGAGVTFYRFDPKFWALVSSPSVRVATNYHIAGPSRACNTIAFGVGFNANKDIFMLYVPVP